MDWGVFHVEQPFFRYWRHAKLALLNRNNLLKADAPTSELEPWTNELVKNALHIDHFRSAYTESLSVELVELIKVLLGEELSHKFQFNYIRGWNPESSLLDQLQEDIAKDRKYGFTTAGPHKADLHFQFGNFNAADILSRGQLKLLVCALKIAQSRLLYRSTNSHCIFLLDDLPAELDAENRRKVCSLLAGLQDQVFMTSIEEESLLPHVLSAYQDKEASYKVFHVEHGTIGETTAPSNLNF
jgi:DNA replication and repair protein RecF